MLCIRDDQVLLPGELLSFGSFAVRRVVPLSVMPYRRAFPMSDLDVTKACTSPSGLSLERACLYRTALSVELYLDSPQSRTLFLQLVH